MKIFRKLLRSDLDKRVLYLLIMLGVGLLTVHGTLFFLYNFSRGGISNNLTSSSALKSLRLRGDPRQSLFSSAVINRPCDFDLKSDCTNQSDPSSAVQSLSKQQLPFEVRQLLERHTYSTAFSIVKALLTEGHDQEAVALLGNEVFDSNNEAVVFRSNFANSWYLLPAMSYASHNREVEGLSLFKQYLDVMRIPVRNGHWLSQPGLDSTDLPVLADIFCQETERLRHDECLLSLLQLASTQVASFAEDYSDDEDSNVQPDLRKAYGNLASYIKSAPLYEYLSIWSWDTLSSEPTIGNLTSDQIAAWNYAMAVRLLYTDGHHKDCSNHIERSRALLTLVSMSGDSFGYFKRAAENRLSYIAKHSDDLCKVGDDDESSN